MDIADFLLARIAEDEARARHDIHLEYDYANYPDRMLADCAAKRRIVEQHQFDDDGNCDECGTGVQDSGPGDRGSFDPTPWPCTTLRYLALPFADHPDYREEWRP